jgi:hypothetical protein
MGILGQKHRVGDKIAGHEGRLDPEQAIAGGSRAKAIEGKTLGLRGRGRGGEQGRCGDPRGGED